jgi:hypothetical protein
MTSSTVKIPLDSQITFVQHFLPPLPSGPYTINVQQKVKGKDKYGEFDDAGQYKNEQTFVVRGDRFNLKPDEIKSVFPPPHSEGDFSGVLPHIVLTQKGIPWEWTLKKGPQKPDAEGDVASWLALLVFDAKDPPPKPVSLTLADLTANLPANTISYPNLKFQLGEETTDPVMVIDIPIELFNAIMPSEADLTYLAHARTVSLLKKATQPENASTNYAVVVANRLPQQDRLSTVHLVCLVDMAPYLPNTDYSSSSKLSEFEKVRLVSLKSWQFSSVTEQYNFSKLLTSINKAPFQLVKNMSGPNDTEQWVSNVLNMGYIPLQHHTRQGSQTVSWYRGPLTPYHVERKSINVVGCADALIRYNPNTGLFDESYAAAWQLGRLLALKAPEFSSSLYKWKRSQQIATVKQKEQTIVSDVMVSVLGEGVDPTNMMEKTMELIKTLAESLSDSSLLEGKPQKISVQPQPSYQAIKEHLEEPLELEDEDKTGSQNQHLLDTIKNWLGRLKLLYGVPFNYLVPNIDLLPPESLRFFELDLNWINCLVDGALSIGRVGTVDIKHDQTQTVPYLDKLATKASRKTRFQLLGIENGDANQPDFPVVSGFLLRSVVVSAYPGLEVEGYNKNQALTILRLERLAPTVLFCLFEGEVNKIVLKEPPEALHFGVEFDQNNQFVKEYLRSVEALNGYQPGSQITLSNDPIRVDFRNGNKNTIKVSSLADEIEKKLKKKKGILKGNIFTSAEFALQMVQESEQVNFVNDQGKP